MKTVHAKILEAKCVPGGKDPLGAVANGYLKVSAPLIELTAKTKISWKYDYDFPEKTNLYYLFIREVSCGAHASPSRGLVIKQRRDISDSTFERVGWFGLSSGEEVDMIGGIKDSIVTII
jgi:hypothetical protein